MSMPYKIIRCVRCDQTWGSNRMWGYFIYVLPDQKRVFIDRELAWCKECSCFRPVEIIPSEEEIISHYHSEKICIFETHNIPYKGRRLVHLISWDLLDVIFKLLKLRLETSSIKRWRRMRTAPPRCLECSSTHVIHTDYNPVQSTPYSMTFSHPDCGGRLKVVDSDIRIISGHAKKFYDVNGIRQKD